MYIFGVLLIVSNRNKCTHFSTLCLTTIRRKNTYLPVLFLSFFLFVYTYRYKYIVIEIHPSHFIQSFDSYFSLWCIFMDIYPSDLLYLFDLQLFMRMSCFFSSFLSVIYLYIFIRILLMPFIENR
jgi:hypothetical protein